MPHKATVSNSTAIKKVHEYENAIEDKGSLHKNERMTCRDCGKLKSEHEEHL